MNDQELRKTLKESLDEAYWTWLRKHAERDAIILIAPEMDLLETALTMAKDDHATVQSWIVSGKVSKPTQVQLDAWNSEPTRRFLSIVVQPYVLVQEILS
jgi:hypothetical protein